MVDFATVAAHRKHLCPDEHLVVLLAAHKRRGVPFGRAWRVAMRTARVRQPGETFDGRRLLLPPAEHREWRDLFSETRVAWRDAYEDRESGCGRAVLVLAAF